jgi:hypothetical protein
MIEVLRKHRRRLRGSLPPKWLSVDYLIERFQEHLDAMAEASDKEIEWREALEREAELLRNDRVAAPQASPIRSTE